MLREIEFRALRADGIKENPWVYGSLINKNGSYFILKTFKISKYSKRLGYAEIEIKPESIGQFTGFRDRKGNKVFEDDIVTAWSAGSSGTFTVKWRQEASPCWLLYPNWQERQHWNIAVSEYKIGKKLLSADGSVYKCTTDGFFDEGLEVIGNIHEREVPNE